MLFSIKLGEWLMNTGFEAALRRIFWGNRSDLGMGDVDMTLGASLPKPNLSVNLPRLNQDFAQTPG
ncbi:hypothetical protein [Microcoleus sp. bin38.metabat.b11b12b14.051]|uniref:hypothetical protein n=1 Tax=Microcoleus sp. bin38.metabat.b11b12b14.051 TaxID=2742709 RepID=UPI00260105C7|nr:hypothetical protein [Microcoleus sp. bin38.metabat.b11b12b14.051]